MTRHTEVMIDIETLGTSAGCAVLSIGAMACRSLSATEHDEWTFEQGIDVIDCVAHGLTVHADTARWWMRQPREVRANLVTEGMYYGLPETLRAFAAWLDELPKPRRLWANSPAFDLAILAAAYRAAGQQVPWTFREECCYRTLRGLVSPEHVPRIAPRVAHDALEDARAQMAQLHGLLVCINPPGIADNPDPARTSED